MGCCRDPGELNIVLLATMLLVASILLWELVESAECVVACGGVSEEEVMTDPGRADNCDPNSGARAGEASGEDEEEEGGVEHTLEPLFLLGTLSFTRGASLSTSIASPFAVLLEFEGSSDSDSASETRSITATTWGAPRLEEEDWESSRATVRLSCSSFTRPIRFCCGGGDSCPGLLS